MKGLNWFASVIWWLSVACVLISAFTIAAIRLSLEHLADDPENINLYLDNITSKPVSVGNIDLDWRGAIPIISIDSIAYENRDAAINLRSVELQPLLFESILQLDFKFDVALVKTGKIEIFLDQLKEEKNINEIISTITTIIKAGNYLLSDISLKLNKDGKSQEIYIEKALSTFSEGSWRLDLKSHVPNIFNKLDVVIDHTSSALKSIQDLDGRAYISFDLSEEINASSINTLTENIGFISGKSDVWLDFVDGAPHRIQASITDGSITYANQKFDSFATTLIAQRNSQVPDTLPSEIDQYLGMWDLYIPQVSFDFRKNNHQFDGLFFSQINTREDLWFSAEKIDSKAVMPVIAGLLPEKSTTLNKWPINSTIHNLQGYLPISDPNQVVAKAKLENLEVGNKRNEALQIKITAADLSLDQQKVLININPSQTISLRANSVYDHWLTFTHPAAQIAIDWSHSDLVSFSSDNMFVYLEQMSASIDLNYQLDLLEPDLSNLLLQVTMVNAPTSLKDKLVPYKVLPEKLTKTIRDSLKGQGKISGDMLLFVQKGKGSDSIGTELDLKLMADKATITFADYPTISNFTGSAYIDTKGLSIQSPSFNVLFSQVNNFDLNIASDNTIRINGEVRDSLKNLHALSKEFGSKIDFELPSKITAHGDIGVKLDLKVPIDGQSKAIFDAKVTLFNNQLRHVNYRDFPITKINGSFRVTNTELTQERQFEAMFANKPLVFSIENVLLGKSKLVRFSSGFTLPGKIINRLFALKSPLVEGSTTVDILLDFNADSTNFERLIVNSQLTGIKSHIPLGIGKEAGEKVATKLVFERQNKNLFVHLSVKDRIKGMMILDETNKVKGWVGLGLAAKGPIAVSEEKLKVVATYNTIDIAPLFDWFKENQFAEVLGQNQAQIEGTLINNIKELKTKKNTQTSILDAIEVQFIADKIGTSNFFVNNAKSTLYRTHGVWVSDIVSDLVTAKIYYAKAGNAQQIIVENMAIEKIVLPEEDKEKQASRKKTKDPLETFDPRISNPISLQIKNLSYNGSSLGKWSMQIEPENNGVRLNDLKIIKGKVSAKGNAFWQYLPNNKIGQQQLTTANLQVKGQDIKNFLGIVDSKSGSIDTKLSWQASPIGIGYDNVKGDVRIAFQDGFINTEEQAIALLNLIGLLNIDTITKRLSLDFSDQGNNIAYNNMQGAIKINDGLVTNTQPFIFKGPSISMQLEGTTNLLSETVDQTMVIQIPVGEALPLATVLAGFAPQVSVIVLIASYALKKPFTQFTSARFKINGDIEDPKMVLDRLFNVPIEEIKEELRSEE